MANLFDVLKKKVTDFAQDVGGAVNGGVKTVQRNVAPVVRTVTQQQQAPKQVVRTPGPSVQVQAPQPAVNPVAGLFNNASKVYDQVNPFDNNRTFKQRTATNNFSVGKQTLNNSLVKPIPKVINTANALKQDTAGLARAGYESAFGTDDSYQKALNTTKQASDFALTKGIGGVGGYLTPQQAASRGGGVRGLRENFAKPFTTAAAETAPFAVPGAGSLLAKGGSLGARVALEGGLNAGVGAATNAAQQQVNNGRINLKEVGKSAAISGALGAATPVAGAVARRGYTKGVEAAAGKPYRNVSDQEVSALRTIAQQRQGYGASVANPSQADFAVQRSVQDRLRLGTDIAGLDNIVNARNTYDTRLQAAGNSPLKLVNDRIAAPFERRGLALGNSLKPTRDAIPRGFEDIAEDAQKLTPEQFKAKWNLSSFEGVSRLKSNPNGNEYFGKSLAHSRLKVPSGMNTDEFYRLANDIGDGTPTNLSAGLPPQAQKAPIELPGVDTSFAKNSPAAQVEQPLAKGRANRGFTDTVMDSGMTDRRVAAGLYERDNSYRVRNTKNLQVKAKNLVNDNEDMALQMVRNGNDDNAVAVASELIKKYQDNGNIEGAISIAEQIAPKLTEAGRAAQAASIYGRLTPAGALRFAQRQIDAYNEQNGLVRNGVPTGRRAPATLNPERAAEITALSKKIETLPDGDEKLELTGRLVDLMNSAAPTPALTKIANIWRAGLLTSLRTLEGGVIGNATKATLDLPSNAIAAGVDKFVTAPLLNKGVRSNAFTLKGNASGFAEGVGRGSKYLKTGIDPRDVGRGYDTKPSNYEGGGVLNTLGKGSDYVYRAMGSIDNPFYYRGLRNAEAEQRVLARKNGTDPNNLSNDAIEQATNSAKEGVFQNDTSLGTIASKLKNAPQAIKDPQSRAAAQAVVDFTVPFVKIPSAVATALVEYSPAGPAATIIKQTIKREADVRELNRSIGRGATGTIAGVAVGSQLYNQGLLTLDEPQDANEKQLWALEGKQPFSVKIGGKWRRLNYVQPLGSLMAVGGGYERAKAEGTGNPVVVAAASGLKSVSEQSFVTGIKNAVDAIQSPEQKAQTFANSMAGSFIPNVVRDIARAGDKFERQTNNPLEALKAGLPGLRQENLPQTDPFGKPIPTKQSPAGVVADPFKSTTDKAGKDPVTAEIRRLYEIDRNNPDFKVAPSNLTKQQTFAGQSAVLNPKQLDNYKQTVGPQAYNEIKQALQSQEYKELSDTDKAASIKRIVSGSRQNSKADFAATNTLKDKRGNVLNPNQDEFKTSSTTVGGSGSGKRKEVAKNLDVDSATFLKNYNKMSSEKRTKASREQNDFDYKLAVANYENDKKKGTLTKAQDIKARNAIDKAKVGKDFNKDTRELYSLSKGDLFDYLNSKEDGVDKKKIADDLIKYGDAQKKAGLISKNKFRDKYGNVDFDESSSNRKYGRGGKKKGGKGRKGSKMSVPGISATNYSGTASVGRNATARLAQKKYGSGGKSGGSVRQRSTKGDNNGKKVKRQFA